VISGSPVEFSGFRRLRITSLDFDIQTYRRNTCSCIWTSGRR